MGIPDDSCHLFRYKIRDIILLDQTTNLSKRKISRTLNISRPAVDHYLQKAAQAELTWADVKGMDNEELLQRLERSEETSNDPRYTELKRLLPDIAEELGKKYVTRQLLWEEYKTDHPDGYGYSQFCYHLQMYLADSELAMHLPMSRERDCLSTSQATSPFLPI